MLLNRSLLLLIRSLLLLIRSLLLLNRSLLLLNRSLLPMCSVADVAVAALSAAKVCVVECVLFKV